MHKKVLNADVVNLEDDDDESSSDEECKSPVPYSYALVASIKIVESLNLSYSFCLSKIVEMRRYGVLEVAWHLACHGKILEVPAMASCMASRDQDNVLAIH